MFNDEMPIGSNTSVRVTEKTPTETVRTSKQSVTLGGIIYLREVTLKIAQQKARDGLRSLVRVDVYDVPTVDLTVKPVRQSASLTLVSNETIPAQDGNSVDQWPTQSPTLPLVLLLDAMFAANNSNYIPTDANFEFVSSIVRIINGEE